MVSPTIYHTSTTGLASKKNTAANSMVLKVLYMQRVLWLQQEKQWSNVQGSVSGCARSKGTKMSTFAYEAISFYVYSKRGPDQAPFPDSNQSLSLWFRSQCPRYSPNPSSNEVYKLMKKVEKNQTNVTIFLYIYRADKSSLEAHTRHATSTIYLFIVVLIFRTGFFFFLFKNEEMLHCFYSLKYTVHCINYYALTLPDGSILSWAFSLCIAC